MDLGSVDETPTSPFKSIPREGLKMIPFNEQGS